MCIHVHLGMKNNVAGGSFPFRRTKKPFCIFWVPKMRCFVKQAPHGCFKMVPPHFSKLLYHLTCMISQPGNLKPFHPLLMKKTNSCRITWKSVRFELQVHDLMLMIFGKNHFKFHKMIWMSYLDSSHFSDRFRHIIYWIPIYELKNINYFILDKKNS